MVLGTGQLTADVAGAEVCRWTGELESNLRALNIQHDMASVSILYRGNRKCWLKG